MVIESSELEALRVLIGPTAERLRVGGHELYFVGGIVRDLILGGGDFSDVDLTTDARPKAIKAALQGSADALWTQGERFGTIGAMIGEHAFEITTHRAESYDEASRKPVVSFGDDLETDLSRRDFTINSMAIDVATGELVDPYGGRSDLAARQLRTPLDPEISFTDDPLRMLRAARFIPRFGLAAEPDLVATALALRERMTIVSGERIHDELAKLLNLRAPLDGLRFLAETGLLGQIGLGSAAESLEAVAALPTASARRAGLLLELSEDEVAAFLQALRFSNADRRTTIRTLAGARQLTAAVLDAARFDPLSFERLAPELRATAALVGAAALDDVVALLPLLQASETRILAITQSLTELRAREDLDDRRPPLEGNEIMELLGVPPGPAIGEALGYLESLRLEQGPLSADQARAELRRWAAEP